MRYQNIIFSSLKYLLDHKINLKDMDIKIHPLKNKKSSVLVYKIKKIISTNSNDPLILNKIILYFLAKLPS